MPVNLSLAEERHLLRSVVAHERAELSYYRSQICFDSFSLPANPNATVFLAIRRQLVPPRRRRVAVARPSSFFAPPQQPGALATQLLAKPFRTGIVAPSGPSWIPYIWSHRVLFCMTFPAHVSVPSSASSSSSSSSSSSFYPEENPYD